MCECARIIALSRQKEYIELELALFLHRSVGNEIWFHMNDSEFKPYDGIIDKFDVKCASPISSKRINLLLFVTLRTERSFNLNRNFNVSIEPANHKPNGTRFILQLNHTPISLILMYYASASQLIQMNLI